MSVIPISLEEFRNLLIAAFPPKPFHGLVSTHDECDDGIHLRRELPGKHWDELSNEVLFHGSIALALLEPDALVAFLPAWLLRSMETFDRRSIVLEFTLYFLSPGNEHDGWNEKRIAEIVMLFDIAQRKVVGQFLQSILNDQKMRGLHSHAEFGLRWWILGHDVGTSSVCPNLCFWMLTDLRFHKLR